MSGNYLLKFQSNNGIFAQPTTKLSPEMHVYRISVPYMSINTANPLPDYLFLTIIGGSVDMDDPPGSGNFNYAVQKTILVLVKQNLSAPFVYASREPMNAYLSESCFAGVMQLQAPGSPFVLLTEPADLFLTLTPVST